MKICKFFIFLYMVLCLLISCEDSDVNVSADEGNRDSNSAHKIYYTKLRQDDVPDIYEYNIKTEQSNLYLYRATIGDENDSPYIVLGNYDNRMVQKGIDNAVTQTIFSKYDNESQLGSIYILNDGRVLSTIYDNKSGLDLYVSEIGGVFPGTKICDKINMFTTVSFVNNESKLACIRSDTQNGQGKTDSLFTVDLKYPYNVKFICDGIDGSSLSGDRKQNIVLSLTSKNYNENINQIVKVNLDTKKKTILTKDETCKANCSLSPDGDKVIYSSDIGDYSIIAKVCVLDLGNNNISDILQLKFGYGAFKGFFWADDDNVAFYRVIDVNNEKVDKLWIAKLSTKRVKEIGEKCSI